MVDGRGGIKAEGVRLFGFLTKTHSKPSEQPRALETTCYEPPFAGKWSR